MCVEVLLWLVPSAVATLVAMGVVAWLGREGRGAVDREVAVRRMGAVLDRPDAQRRLRRTRRRPPGYAAPPSEPDRSTGIAVRPSRRAS